MKTGQGVRNVAIEIARPDGTILSLSANYQALKDDTGAISGLVISFSDITRRDHVLQSLVESQERLREAHELARLSSWEWRPETNEVFAFHAVAPEDEALMQGSTPLEDVLAAIPHDAREIARENLASIARGERDPPVQRHHYGYETGPVWIETRLRAIRDAEGTLLCVRGTSQDVTDQELAKQEVTTQAALLEEVDVAVIATDAEGRITHWNRGARQLHGWTNAEMVGRDAVAFLAPTDALALGEAASELDRAGHWEGEYTVRHKDGSTFPAYVRARVILDGDGERSGWIGVASDLTKRLESERALRTASNYLRAVADSVGDGLFTLDTEGRVTYMNDAAELLLGWSRDELAGRAMRAVARAVPLGPAPDEWPILNAHYDDRARRIEDIFIRRDGRELPVAYSASSFETDDGIQGCVVVFQDITERRAREEELEHEARKLTWIGRIQEALADDQFVLYAQPIVDVRPESPCKTSCCCACASPTGRSSRRAAFLQIAEDYGLIGDIDRWVIARGAEIAAAGRPVELNLSAHSVSEAGDPGSHRALHRAERRRSDAAGVRDHRDRADPGRGRRAALRRACPRAGLQGRARRLRHRLRRLHLPQAAPGRLPQDRHRVRTRSGDEPGQLPCRRGGRRARAGVRSADRRRGRRGRPDARAAARAGRRLAQGYHIARPGPLAESPLTSRRSE